MCKDEEGMAHRNGRFPKPNEQKRETVKNQREENWDPLEPTLHAVLLDSLT